MTKFLAFIFLALVAAKSCGDAPQENLDKGIITEIDDRDCACCGGWLINIGKETFRFYDIPKNSEMKLNAENLPMEVELKWEKQENACMGDEINVLYIRKNE